MQQSICCWCGLYETGAQLQTTDLKGETVVGSLECILDIQTTVCLDVKDVAADVVTKPNMNTPLSQTSQV